MHYEKKGGNEEVFLTLASVKKSRRAATKYYGGTPSPLRHRPLRKIKAQHKNAQALEAHQLNRHLALLVHLGQSISVLLSDRAQISTWNASITRNCQPSPDDAAVAACLKLFATDLARSEERALNTSYLRYHPGVKDQKRHCVIF